MITFTMIMRPAWGATNARAIASCLKRNQSACAAAGQSMIQEPEVEARGKFLGHLQRDNSFREVRITCLCRILRYYVAFHDTACSQLVSYVPLFFINPIHQFFDKCSRQSTRSPSPATASKATSNPTITFLSSTTE